MAERETKSKTEQEKGRRRQETQPVAEQSKQGGLLEYSQLSEVLSGLSFVEQSSLVNGSGLVDTQKAEAILALQQTYGNRYVASLAEGNSKMNPGEGSNGKKSNAKAKPLEPHIRSQMEKTFNKDLGSVKIAEGDNVAESSSDVAVTKGETIHFAPGIYNPETKQGRHIIGHELAHFVQQTNTDKPPDSDIELEREAMQAGYDSALGQEVSIAGAAAFGQPQGLGEALGEALYRWDPLRLRTYSVAQVLEDNDPDLISRLNRDQIRRASVEDRVALIRLAMRAHLEGIRDIELIWGTFSSTQLLEVGGNNMELWQDCVRLCGSRLEELQAVTDLQNEFKWDVIGLARNYLNTNRRHVISELERIGVSGTSGGRQPPTMAAPRARPITEEQTARTQEIQRVAAEVLRCQEAEDRACHTPVGYNWVRIPAQFGSHGEDAGRFEHAVFDPNNRPQRPPHGDEEPPMASWEYIKEQYDVVHNLLTGFSNRYPIIYALIRENRVADLVRAGDQGQARIVIADVMRSLLEKIDETIPKIGDDIDYRDLRPIHSQLMAGQVPTAVSWNQPLPRWIIEETMRDYELSETIRSLLLGGVAAVAFMVAEIATAGWATVFVCVGIGVGAAQAGMSWERYADLAEAAETNISNETALVTSGQVSSALISAVLDTVFAALDVYSVGARAVRATARAPIIAESVIAGTERVAIPRAIDIASAESRALVERSISELGVEETMRRTGNRPISELVDLVGPNSDAARQLRAHEQAAEAATRASTTITEDLSSRLGNLAAEAAESRAELVQQAIVTLGPKRTIEMAGGWERLSGMIPANSTAGRQLEAWRQSLYVDLQNYLVGRVTTEEGQEFVRRTGTRGFGSDMDITLLGPDAAANRDRAMSFLAGRLGVTPGQLRELIHMQLFTDPRRMHLFDIFTPEIREQIARQTATFEREVVWNRRLYDALQTRESALVSEIRDQMRELGVREVPYRPLSSGQIQSLNRELDSLHTQFEAARQGNDVALQRRLATDIANRQALINASEPGGYYAGGSVRQWVSEREGELTPIPHVEGAQETLRTLTTDEFTAVLNELPFIDESAERLFRSVSRMESGAVGSVADVFAAIKDVGKHGKRLTDTAGRALGVRVPNETIFNEIANAFQDIMARKGAGTLQRDIAGEQFSQLLSNTQRALDQLTDSSVDILRELQSHAGILQTASGDMARIQSYVRSHATLLRTRDGLLRGMRGLRDQALFELRTAAREASAVEREPWEEPAEEEQPICE